MTAPAWNGRDDEPTDDTPRTPAQWAELLGECLALAGILFLTLFA